MAAVAVEPGSLRPPGAGAHLRPARAGMGRTAVRRLHPASVYRRRWAGLAGGAAAVLTALVVGLGSGAAPPALRDAPGAGATAVAPATVVLQPGQTVWDLLLPHTPAGAHPIVYAIEVAAYNEIDPRAVEPGTVLRLPPVRP